MDPRHFDRFVGLFGGLRSKLSRLSADSEVRRRAHAAVLLAAAIALGWASSQAIVRHAEQNSMRKSAPSLKHWEQLLRQAGYKKIPQEDPRGIQLGGGTVPVEPGTLWRSESQKWIAVVDERSQTWLFVGRARPISGARPDPIRLGHGWAAMEPLLYEISGPSNNRPGANSSKRVRKDSNHPREWRF